MLFDDSPLVPPLVRVGACGQLGSGIGGSGFWPQGAVALGWSRTLTATPLVGGPCAGTLVGLRAPRPLAVVVADAAGDFTFLPPGGIPAFACAAAYVQAVDLATCRVSGLLLL